MKDLYKILGVERSASAETLKSAYLNLAKKFHPDANPGHEDWAGRFMTEVNEAYGVLSDPAERKRYDLASRVQSPVAMPGLRPAPADPIETLIGLVSNAAAPWLPADQIQELLRRKAAEMGMDQKPVSLVELAERVGFLSRRVPGGGKRAGGKRA